MKMENGRTTMVSQAFIKAVGKDRAYDHVRWAGGIPDDAQVFEFAFAIKEGEDGFHFYVPCDESDVEVWQLNFYWFTEEDKA